MRVHHGTRFPSVLSSFSYSAGLRHSSIEELQGIGALYQAEASDRWFRVTPMPVGARRTCRIFFVPFVFATASEIAGLISHCTGSVIDSWRCRLNWFRCRTGCADRRPGWFRTVALWVGTTAGEPLALCGKRMVTGSNSRKLPLSSTQPPWAWAGGCGQSCILGQTEEYTGRPPRLPLPACTDSHVIHSRRREK